MTDESTTTLAGGVLATKEPTLPPLLQVQYPPSVHDREARGLAPTALSTTIESQIPQYKNNNMGMSLASGVLYYIAAYPHNGHRSGFYNIIS